VKDGSSKLNSDIDVAWFRVKYFFLGNDNMSEMDPW